MPSSQKGRPLRDFTVQDIIARLNHRQLKLCYRLCDLIFALPPDRQLKWAHITDVIDVAHFCCEELERLIDLING